MTVFVLIPGAGGQAWYWHRVVPELHRRGHEAIAVDLPAADENAGLPEYADAVVEAIGGRAGGAVGSAGSGGAAKADGTGLVLVAQSLAGFTAPLVCARIPVDLVVLLNAMVPAAGESAGQWWENTGHARARIRQAAREGRILEDDPDLLDAFFHDVPPEVLAEAMRRGAPRQSAGPFTTPWPLERWPDVPTRFLQATGDRFFPLEFQRGLARDRLGLRTDEIPGGHLVALSRPREVADRLGRYAVEAAGAVRP